MRNNKGGKGLDLIAGMLARADVPIQTASKYVDHSHIVHAAMVKAQTMRANGDLVIDLAHDYEVITTKQLREIITEAVKTACEQEARAQRAESEIVNELVSNDYLKRADNLMPAVAAAVMEQSSMTSMRLNLDKVATVFERCSIAFDVEDRIVTYKLSAVRKENVHNNGGQ